MFLPIMVYNAVATHKCTENHYLIAGCNLFVHVPLSKFTEGVAINFLYSYRYIYIFLTATMC